jgi:hypothetical protein
MRGLPRRVEAAGLARREGVSASRTDSVEDVLAAEGVTFTDGVADPGQRMTPNELLPPLSRFDAVGVLSHHELVDHDNISDAGDLRAEMGRLRKELEQAIAERDEAREWARAEYHQMWDAPYLPDNAPEWLTEPM